MTFDRLLAKSRGPGGWWHESMLLAVHLADVHRAARLVLQHTGSDQVRAVGLSSSYCDRLCRIVTLAAALHDLGKANDHFQRMLRDADAPLQGLRHEWVTLLMIQRPEWRKWLRPAVIEEVDLELVAWAVAGHHPAYGRASPPERAEAGSNIRLLMGHADFPACLDVLRQAFALGGELPPCTDEVLTLRESISDGAFGRISAAFIQAKTIWAGSPDECRRLLAVAKACLIAADVAGSALPRAGVGMAWIGKALTDTPGTSDLKMIVEDRLGGKPLRQFQRDLADQSNRVVLARAGCGSGKTLAAYQWAAQQCSGRRIYVCYPTTGTATEGFRDYLFDTEVGEGKFGARLFHGRAEVDRDIILSAGRDDDGDAGMNDALGRLASLEAWATPIVSCTVDTVLGLMQNHRKGLYAWPALAQSAFVFDEIHAYDEKLFGALLRFLSVIRGARVLLMTASLPEPRLAAIRRCLAEQGEKLAEVGGPAELEQLPRYHRLFPVDPQDPISEIRGELARGGRVLWVCNLVDRVMRFANRYLDLKPLVYHSRFRYVDRVERHKAVIDAFNQSQGSVLAICTQVAEMSLDLSATMLVTDMAPVPAMIQRLGRLNRRALPLAPPAKPATMPFIIVEPTRSTGEFTTFPYDTSTDGFGDWPSASRAWLNRIGESSVSQANLAVAWESEQSGGKVRPCESKWLDGGPRTQVDALRDTSPGITVVLDQDVPSLKTGALRLVEAAIPMPVPHRCNWKAWDQFNHVPIAPPEAIDYDHKRGASWRK